MKSLKPGQKVRIKVEGSILSVDPSKGHGETVTVTFPTFGWLRMADRVTKFDTVELEVLPDPTLKERVLALPTIADREPGYAYRAYIKRDDVTDLLREFGVEDAD